MNTKKKTENRREYKINREMLAGMNLQYRWYSFDYFLDAMQELGFRSIAVWGGPPHFYCDHLMYEDTKKIKNSIRNRSLKITGFLVTASQYRYQPAYEEPEQFERSFRYFSKGLCACAELESPIMTICSGYGYFDHSRQDAFSRSADMLHRLSEKAEEYGVLLALESLKMSESQICVSLHDVREMMDAVSHPALKVIADTGAIYDNGETLEQWFGEFGDDIVGMHFVDRQHMLWGEGGLPLDSMIASIVNHRFTGPLMLETSVRKYMDDPKAADQRALNILDRFVRKE